MRDRLGRIDSLVEESLTIETPIIERDSCRAMPTDWPVQRSRRVVISFSITSVGMPG